MQMLKKIYKELTKIRRELQSINKTLESRQGFTIAREPYTANITIRRPYAARPQRLLSKTKSSKTNL